MVWYFIAIYSKCRYSTNNIFEKLYRIFYESRTRKPLNTSPVTIFAKYMAQKELSPSIW